MTAGVLPGPHLPRDNLARRCNRVLLPLAQTRLARASSSNPRTPP